MREAMMQHIVKEIFGHDSALSQKTLENLDVLEWLQTGGHIQLQKNISIIRNRHQFIIEEVHEDVTTVLPVRLTYEQVSNAPCEIEGFRFQFEKCKKPFSDKRLQLNLKQSRFPDHHSLLAGRRSISAIRDERPSENFGSFDE